MACGVTPRAIFSDFGRYGQEVAPGVFFLDGSSELWLITPTLHTPDRAEYDHPDAWRTDDGLKMAGKKAIVVPP